MDYQLDITLIILVAALILFVTELVPADLVALLVVVALGVTGVLTPAEAFSGFSRSAVITILAIFILASALQRTGVTEQVGNLLLKFGGRSELRLTVLVMLAGAFLSLFMNNIAAAAVLLPAVSGAAKKASVQTSRLMMPLAFGTILGGTATLLTTTNIVINSLLHDSDIEGFSLTDFAPIGLLIVVAGITYMAVFGRHLLPGESIIEKSVVPNRDDADDLISAYNLGANLFRARVPDNSFLIGKTLHDSTLRPDFGVSVVGIERRKKRLLALSPETEIKKGDTLLLEGDEEDFRRRDVEPYMVLVPKDEWTEHDLESQSVEVVEAMLSPRSRLIGETLTSTRFRDKYGVSVLAIWRGTQQIVTNLAETQLQFGDALLLQGTRERLAVLDGDPDIIVFVEGPEREITFPHKGRAALLIFGATLLFAIVFPDIIGPIMLGGALMMMLTRILTTDQAYASVSWRTIFLVAGMLPMGIALNKTNAAGLMADQVLGVLGGYGPMVILAGLFILTVVLVQAVNGAVVATIIGPTAIHIAQQMHADPRSMAMGVALATSMAFITPLGHPVNILVMSPGGYSFKDFMKVGLPLTAIIFAVVMIFMPIFWPLQ
ncbi:MAG: SLC13 family permease [Acidobacteriota bacterium]